MSTNVGSPGSLQNYSSLSTFPLASLAGNGALARALDSGTVYVSDGSGWRTFGSGGGTGTVTSVATGTGLSGGPVTTTGTIVLADTAVTPGSYTKANVTVDQQGRITSAANGSAVTSVATGTGLTGGTITTTGTISLANTAVTPGAYTSANITVDQQGRITLAANGSGGGGSTTYAWQGSILDQGANHWEQTTNGSFGNYTVVGSPVIAPVINKNFGSVTQSTSHLPGVVITAPITGTMRVEFAVSLGAINSAAAAASHSLRIFEINSSTSLISILGLFLPSALTNTFVADTAHLVGFIDVTATTSYEFRLQGAMTSGTATGYVGDVGAEGLADVLTISLTYVPKF